MIDNSTKDKLKNETPHFGNTLLPAVLICDCNSTEHQIVVYPEDEDGLVYCHIHLIHYGFW